MNPTFITAEQMLIFLLFLASCGLFILFTIAISYIAVKLFTLRTEEKSECDNHKCCQYSNKYFGKHLCCRNSNLFTWTETKETKEYK